MKICICNTKLGDIHIAEQEGAITGLFFETDEKPRDCQQAVTPLLREAMSQLDAYLRGELTVFALPLNPQGTPFMMWVWEQLQAIPFGDTSTYKQIAERYRNARYARAVGSAIHRNPIPIFIPCHRVVGSNGLLTGFRGGLPMKAQLLHIEGHTQ